ncbi:hypothetical protein ACH3VS_41075 [Streptomyces sp. WSLK1-3]|uniref:hypothetical protein n=1 Tax=Streptomyces sp. WSLK1-3 TaxID=3375475 RepID=UPI0037AC4D3F
MDHRIGNSKDECFVGSGARASTSTTRPTPGYCLKPADQMYTIDSYERDRSWSIVQDAG